MRCSRRGIPPKNWRSGLSAHDVYMAICNKDIIVTRAKKRLEPNNKKPLVAAHGIVMNALGLNGDIDDGASEKAWLAKLEPKTTPQLAVRPSPCPPWQAAPPVFGNRIVPITDPYAIYAKKILRLKPLDDIDRIADPALRGICFMLRSPISSKQIRPVN